jgi:hypothetical protein
MTSPYLSYSAFIHTFTTHTGRTESHISTSSINSRSGQTALDGQTGYWSSTPLCSGPEALTQLYNLYNQIQELKGRLITLELRPIPIPISARIPLGLVATENVVDQAYRDLTQQNLANSGEQVSLWDGIEQHVVRATERAHGIQ